jgi:predicted outer membrane repeat protein
MLNAMKHRLPLSMKNFLKKAWKGSVKSPIPSVILLLASIFCYTSSLAQLASPTPNFTNVSGTVLSNTNDQWVRIDPAQPNNIDLIETRIFKTPKKGSGIVAIEFKLVGADGGTAWYDDGAFNNFANGGRGGELAFTLKLNGILNPITLKYMNTYDRPFLLTFGKKGENIRYGQGMYCSAGGGGSTGMSWLLPDVNHKFLAWTWMDSYAPSGEQYLLIAGAGGGSGGFATAFEAVHGKSATRYADGYESLYSYEGPVSTQDIFNGVPTELKLTLVAGGSGQSERNPVACCSNINKTKNAASTLQSVFDYQMGGLSNNELQYITFGQGGGKPTVLYPQQDYTPNVNNMGMGGLFYYPVLKNGGKGGAGLSGGGAGSSTTSYYNLVEFSDHNKRNIPTSGAGGVGSAYGAAFPQKYPLPGDDGWNEYSLFLDNVSISPRTATNNPQSGYMMYRTIADTEPPVVNISELTLDIASSPSATVLPLNLNTLAPYIGEGKGISDNDGIKSITFSETELRCFQAGQTVPVYITVTDFAGNSTDGLIMITVVDTYKPKTRNQFELSPNPFDAEAHLRIDVSNGPYMLTAANFPEAYDGCHGSNVIVNFPPTTFSCSDVGNRTINFYYTDSDGNNSPNYTKTFIVEYNETPRLYVDATATGANDGTSWANAFKDLQDAIHYGCSNDGGVREIYVAKGTYYADKGTGMTANDRNASFTLPDNFKLYGGFPNGGGDFGARNPEANPTILSGAIGSGSADDNSYHIVTIAGNNTLLEGFIIRDGYADNHINVGGGGLIIQQLQGDLTTPHSTTLRSCKFLNNFGTQGGAVYSHFNNSYFYNEFGFQNCLFDGNTSSGNAGAVYLSNDNTISTMRQSFVNCVFNNNSAAVNGGALYTKVKGNVNAVNCTFGYNNAGAAGGAIYNQGTFKLHNSILYHNNSDNIYNSDTFEVDYSDIQGSGGSTGWALSGVQDYGHNIDADPLFYISPALSILKESPARNAGKNAYNNEPYDIYGNNVRVSQDVIDMGAFEVNSVLYVAADAPAGGDGNSWATALNNLNDAITAAGSVTLLQKDIWVKEGTYRPDRLPGSNTVTPGNRDNSFYLNRALKIYGGFAGTETSIAQRSIGQHPTILSGDLGISGIPGDNAYHVVTMMAGDARLDGLIIENGNANHATETDKQRGGGVIEYSENAGGTNIVANCVFRNNNAVLYGGAWYVRANKQGTTNFVQSIFYGNTAFRGAASYVLMNHSQADNYNQNYYNVTATGNVNVPNTPGSGVFEASELSSSNPAHIRFYNGLLSGNGPQNYSDVTNPGHITLTNTYNAAANTGIFVNAADIAGADGKIMTADDGIKLSLSSPAINYGDNALVFSGTDKDVTGSQRIVNTVDAGAYESPYAAPLIADGNGIIYVKLHATGNGADWGNATGDLHNAIQLAGVQKVFVAKGTYKVGDNSFIMKNGVQIYGGFDPDNNITDLSHNRITPNAANQQGSVLDGENARPVIWNVFSSSTAMDNTAVLDGFTVIRGTYSNGAGIRNVYASPTLTNLLIIGNSASVSGAGIYNENSSPLVTNVVISTNIIVNTNTNASVNGAGVSNTASSVPVFTNVTMAGNILIAPLGTMKGAGMYSNNSSPKIYNSILWNNQKMNNPVISGADLEKEGSGTLSLQNSISQLYNTGNSSDNNKVNINPMFVSLGIADYRLMEASPAVNAGSNTLYAGLNTNSKDLANNSRVYDFANNGKVDMGAYEYQCIPMDYSAVTFDDVTLAYDGTPHSVGVQNLPQGASVTYEITDAANQTTSGNTATNAGVYTIQATMTATGANCSSVTKTATLTIEKAAALITTHGIQSYVYDGTAKNVTATLNHTEAALTYGPQQGYAEAGSYWVTISVPETANYLSASENVALVIENADFMAITLADADFTYDGNPKSLAITGTLPAGAILVYAGNEKTDAGTYTVNALIQLPNYNDLWLTATMTITDPLPVRWISFEGKLNDLRRAVLAWRVDQTSVSGYKIERSSNARDFRMVGSVAPTGDGISAYSFTDPVAATGTVYYRIRQTDLDGSYSYSRIITLTGPEGVQLVAYPNPVSTIVTVQVGAEYLGTELRLVNPAGVVLQQLTVREKTFQLNLDKYPTGIYLLHTWDDKVVKLIKN